MLKFFKKYSKWVSVFILGVALIAVYKTFNSFEFLGNLLYTVVKAVSPFILAFVVAYLLNIPITKLRGLIEKRVKVEFIRKHSLAFSIAAVYVLALVAVAFLLGAILPALFRNLIDMATNLPQYAEDAVDYINGLPVMGTLGIKINSADINEFFKGILRSINNNAYAAGIFSITSGLMSFASEAVKIFIGLIASVYMLVDKERILRGLRRIITAFSKSDKTEQVMERFSYINMIFTQYIYSRLICCMIMAVVCSIILSIMGEKYALLLGIFIGVMDIIPYFGSIISWIVGAIIMAISGGLMHSVWCSILMLIMQQIDGNVIAPRVMGSRLEIRPLTIIIAVSVGGTLFGFVGMIISVPVVAVLKLVFTDYLQLRETAVQAEAEASEAEED